MLASTLLGLILVAPVALAANAKIVTTCTKAKTFAITYDDGPYIYQPNLQKTLAKYKAKATFFVNGQNWGCIYDQAEQLQKAHKAGHVIGSHTWNHSDVTLLSDKEFNNQLDKVEVALKKILNVKPRLFRFPYGAYNQAKLNILAKRGYTAIQWSFDSGDTTGLTTTQSKSAYSKLAASYPKPQIALNHEVKVDTVNTVTPYALNLLYKKGYKLVTVSDCLGVTPYQTIYSTKLPKRDASWKC